MSVLKYFANCYYLFRMLFSVKNIHIITGSLILIIFSLLIFKDPFSLRTLIPNLEPYPDTIYYINPALGLIRGEGFKIGREGRYFTPNVPPLYSLSLIPAFIIKPDPRMVYFTNVGLALGSLLLFWSILRKIFDNRLIIYSLLFLYITNYFIYWMPTLVMAENLTLTLYLAGILFLFFDPSKRNILITSVLAICIYATKYASMPLSAAIVLMYLLKLFTGKLMRRKKINSATLFICGLILSYLILQVFEQMFKGDNTLSQIWAYLSIVLNSIPQNNAETAGISSGSGWFGIQYIEKNIPFYIRSLTGYPNKFLWDNTPLVPNFVAIGGLTGIFLGLLNKKFRYISASFVIIITASVLFMSTFYTYDARYIYIAIPTLIIGFGILLATIENYIGKYKKYLIPIGITVIIIFYLSTNFIRIKSQISINLRYAETPWNYIAVLKTNEFFTADKIRNERKPVLISALAPFLVDYYSNGNYTLLPLSYDQEFRGFKTLVWGSNDYSDLIKLYEKYIADGYDLYVSRAGLGNESYTNRDFDSIVKSFNTTLVQEGCYQQCNVYRVELKE